MKNMHITYLIALLLFAACKQEIEPVEASFYDCEVSFADSSEVHPKASAFQALLEEEVARGLPGAIMLVKDADGLWLGAEGYADIGHDVEMQKCHKHLIASISKPFTAAVTFKLIEEGLISLDQKATDFLDESFTKRIANAEEATIRQMLAHTSGIPDYLDGINYDLAIFNQPYWKAEQEAIMKFAKGRKATNAPGESYYYSNSNYVLLAMIIEKASGLTLSEAYQKYVFDPLGLGSYYGVDPAIPAGTVKGYLDIYGNGNMMQVEHLYENELRTGDGGIAASAYDLMIFIEALLGGELVSESSLAVMTDWFSVYGPLYDDYDQPLNGHGLEYFNTPAGDAIGHTGGIYGFSSVVHYFPETDMTFVLLVNGLGGKISEIDGDLTMKAFELISQ
jgi:D-alanyl-D-alanine carboxypeptidase